MPTDQALQPSRVEALALKVLMTDLSRALDAPPAAKPGKARTPRDVGELVVSAQPHGLYRILDGNRHAALLQMTRGDMHVVSCQVYEGLTPEQEDQIITALRDARNGDRKPTPLDKFLDRRAQGDEAAESITRLATSLGWEISERQTSANIVAVASLERIYWDGDPATGNINMLAMWQTLYAVTRVWGHQRDAVNGDVLLGVGLALLAQRGQVDLDGLIRRMGRFRGGPRTLLDTAREARQRDGGCTVAEAIARLLTP